MSPLLTQILIIFSTTGVFALVGWVWALWMSHNNHKIHVAENYARMPSIDKIETKIDELKRSFDELVKAVYTDRGRHIANKD